MQVTNSYNIRYLSELLQLSILGFRSLYYHLEYFITQVYHFLLVGCLLPSSAASITALLLALNALTDIFLWYFNIKKGLKFLQHYQLARMENLYSYH